MSMPLHLFKTDLKRTWIPLAVWLVIVALQFTLVGAAARPGDQVMAGILFALSVASPLFAFVVMAVLIPLVVQEEPLVGTTAFWLTRPIARAELLRAKTLYFGLLALLPLVVELVVLATNGFSRHDLMLALPEMLLSALMPIVALTLIAVLTPSFGRFALIAAILLVATVLTSMAITAIRELTHPNSLLALARAGTLLKTRTAVGNGILILGGGATIVHQYLTRRTARSWIAAASVVLLMTVVTNFWPWDWLAVPPIDRAAAPVAPAALGNVTIALQRTDVQDVATLRGITAPPKYLSAQYTVSGLPDGLFAIAQSATVQLSRADGTPVALGSDDTTTSFSLPAFNTDAIEHTLGDVTVVNPGFSFWMPARLLTLSADVFSRNAGVPLQLKAEVPFIVYRYEIVTEMPVQCGARFDRGSEHGVVTDVLHQGDGIEVVLDVRRANLMFDRSSEPLNPNTAFERRVSEAYVLMNRKRHQVVLTKRNPAFDIGAMLMSGQRLVRNVVRLPYGSEPMAMAPVLDDAWLADATLVRLQRVAVGTFSRPLVVDGFKLNGTNSAVARPSLPARGPNPSLAHLELPPNATKGQVKEYAQNILLASQRRGAYSPNDPQIELLERVGRGNLDVLLDAEGETPAYGAVELYLTAAINQLATADDKAEILRALPRHHNLVALVVKFNWKVEAHDTLVAALKDPQVRNLPGGWIQAVASFEEPATYPDLLEYLIRCSNRQATFNLIRKLPGIDLTAAVDKAWKNAQRSNIYEQLDGCAMAADFGHAEALDVLINVIKNEENSQMVRRAAVIFRRFTPATGAPDALVDWYEANHDKLSFDERTRRFVIRSP